MEELENTCVKPTAMSIVKNGAGSQDFVDVFRPGHRPFAGS